MARVAFFIERLPPDADPVASFAFELIRSLSDQQHEIRVFSTYEEGAELPPSRARIEILRPFRNWGWLEIPRLLPLLFDFQPDVLHFSQPRAEALRGWTNAMAVLPKLAPLLGRPAVVTTFFDITERDLRYHRTLTRMSDAITVANESQRRLVEAKLETDARPRITILPVPGLDPSRFPQEHSPARSLAEIENIVNQLGAERELIFIPGRVSDHIDPVTLFTDLRSVLKCHDNTSVIFGGDWGRVNTRERHRLQRIFEDANLGSRFALTGSLSYETEMGWLARARLVFAASLPLESLSLAQIFRKALEASAPLVISPQQAAIDALRWRHLENAFICERVSGSWANGLNGALASSDVIERIRSRLPEFSRVETMDQPGNVMSRIYAELLVQRL